jgi:hypothetical protein
MRHPDLWTEIRDRWLLGHSTANMAKALHMHEWEIHNALPRALDHRPPPEAVEQDRKAT